MGKRNRSAAIWRAIQATIDAIRGPRQFSARRIIREQPRLGERVPRLWQAEPLERRVMLSITTVPYIAGPHQIQEGLPYTLQLAGEFDHWTVNWGDGALAYPDLQTVTGSSTTATHTYAQPGTFVISATGYDSYGDPGQTFNLAFNSTFGADGLLQFLNPESSPTQAIALQPDGKILTLGDNDLERFNANGFADTSFQSYYGAPTTSQGTSELQCLAIGANGDIAIGGVVGSGLEMILLNSSGTVLSTGFDSGSAISQATGIAFQQDSQGTHVVVVGDTKGGVESDGSTDASLTIFNMDGSIAASDDQFGEVFPGSDNAQVAIDPGDGSIDVTTPQDHSGDYYVHRFSPTGTPEQGWEEPAGGAIAIQSNGMVLVGGNAELERFTSTGAIDDTFGGDGSVSTQSNPTIKIIPQNNGQIVVLGENFLDRYNSDGSPDDTFDGSGRISTGITVYSSVSSSGTAYLPPIDAATISGDGYEVVTSQYYSKSGYNFFFGSYSYTSNTVSAVALSQSDSLTVIAPPVVSALGSGAAVAGVPYTLNLSAQYPLGDPQSTVNSWIINWGDGTATDPDIQTISGNPPSVTHVFATTGVFSILAQATDDNGTYSANALTVNSGFGAAGVATVDFGGTDGYASAVAIQSDGDILAAGVDGNQLDLAQFNTDGSLDTTFGNNGNGTVSTVVRSGYPDVPFAVGVEPNGGDIIVAGNCNGSVVLVAFNSNGSLDSSFGNDGVAWASSPYDGEGGTVMGIQQNGQILIGIDNSWITGLSAAGTLDPAFGSNGLMYSPSGPMATSADGELIGVGDGSSGMALWTDNGSTIQSDPLGGYIDPLRVIGEPDGDFIVLTSTGGNYFLNAFTADAQPDGNFGVSGQIPLTLANVYGMVSTSDGTILISGTDGSNNVVIALNSNGTSVATPDFNGELILPSGFTLGQASGAFVTGLGGDVSITGQSGGEFAVINLLEAVDPPSFSPPTVTISGNGTADVGIPYTLSLGAVYAASDTSVDSVDSWQINWGDGTSAAPDLQVIPGDPSEVTHIFSGSQGNDSITATATDDTGTYPAAAAVTVLIGSAPTISSFQINGGTNPPRAMDDSITLTFDKPVFLSSTALSLLQMTTSDGTPQQMSFVLSASSDDTAYTLSFTGTNTYTGVSYEGSSLPDGIYDLQVSAQGVTDAVGATMASDQSLGLYRLYGDFYGVGIVNFSDLLLIAQDFGRSNVGQNGAAFPWYLDVNGDELVNFTDLLALDQNYGRTFQPTIAPGSSSWFTIPSATENSSLTIAANAVAYGNSGDALSYTWTVLDENGAAYNLPNGNVTNEPDLVFTPDAAGIWTVEVTVTDTNISLSTGPISQTFSVAPTISGNATADAGVPYNLYLSGESLPATSDNAIAYWLVNWGDGTTPQRYNGNPLLVTYTYGFDSANDDPSFYNITATAYDYAGNSYEAPTGPNGFGVDVYGGPMVSTFQIGDGSAQRSMVTSSTVTFDVPVALSANAFSLTQSSGAGSWTPLSFTLTPSNGSSNYFTTYTLTFGSSADIGGSLPDGVYNLAIDGADVTDSLGVASGNRNYGFYRLYGDFDGTGTVDADDLAIFQSSEGTSTGQSGYLSYADYDGNGTIDANDYAQFQLREGESFAPAGSISFSQNSMTPIPLWTQKGQLTLYAPASAASGTGDPLSYTWSVYDDGVIVSQSSSSNSSLSLTPNSPGDWSVNLEITDTELSLSTDLETDVTVIAAPTISTPATASLASSSTQVNLNVAGNIDGGSSGLNYSWSATSTPPGATVTFINGNTQSATAILTQAGTYIFQADIVDSNYDTATSSVAITVAQAPSGIAPWPSGFELVPGSTQQLSAAVVDQFGNPLTTQPQLAWSVPSGDGSLSFSNGQEPIYQAPTSAGTYTITVTSSGLPATTVTAAITESFPLTIPAAPTIAVSQDGQSATVTWTYMPESGVQFQIEDQDTSQAGTSLQILNGIITDSSSDSSIFTDVVNGLTVGDTYAFGVIVQGDDGITAVSPLTSDLLPSQPTLSYTEIDGGYGPNYLEFTENGENLADANATVWAKVQSPQFPDGLIYVSLEEQDNGADYMSALSNGVNINEFSPGEAVDIPVSPGISYTYQFSIDGSPYSDPITFDDPRTQLTAPTNLSATIEPGGAISLTWNGENISSTTDDAGYLIVEVNPNSAIWTVLSDPLNTSLNGVITVAPYDGLSAPFNVFVVAVDSEGDYSLPSNIITLGDALPVPSTPNNTLPGAVVASALQPDGDLVTFGLSNGSFDLWRYNTDGSLDGGFGTDGEVTTSFGQYVQAVDMTVLSGGQILAVGNDAGQIILAQYTDAGVPDTTFGTDGVITSTFPIGFTASALTVLSDGSIIVAGSVNGQMAVAHYEQDGMVDSDFGLNGLLQTDLEPGLSGSALAAGQNGKFVLAGVGEDGDVIIERYDIDGTLDPTFNGTGELDTNTAYTGIPGNDITAIDVDPVGNVLAVGDYQGQDAILRYTAGGALDTAFGNDGVEPIDFAPDLVSIESVLEEGETINQIVLAGNAGGPIEVACLNPNGSPDTNFAPAGSSPIIVGSNAIPSNLLIEPNGRVLITGESDEGFFADPYGPTATLPSPPSQIPVFPLVPTGGTNTYELVPIQSTSAILTQTTPGTALLGYFKGDGREDLATWNGINWVVDVPTFMEAEGTGQPASWVMSQKTWLMTVPSGLNMSDVTNFLVGQFTGGSKDDIAFCDTNGNWWIAIPNAGSFQLRQWTTSSPGTPEMSAAPEASLVTTGDFNGDGRTDIAELTANNGWVVMLSTGTGFTILNSALPVGTSTNIYLGAGDFEGTGRDEIAIYRRDTAAWHINVFTGTVFDSETWTGTSNWSPTTTYTYISVGDFDGNGYDDIIGVQNNGASQLLLSNGTSFTGSSQSIPDQGNTVAQTQVVTYSGSARNSLLAQGANGSWTRWLYSNNTSSFTTIAWTNTNGGSSTVPSGPAFFGNFLNQADTAATSFNSVYDTISYQLYMGAMKGPAATEQTLSGNDWDQDSLLIQGLNAIGISAWYAYGTVSMSEAMVDDWLGISLASTPGQQPNPTNALVQAGITATLNGTTVSFQHAWVQANMAGPNGITVLNMDPSIKFREYQPGIPSLMASWPYSTSSAGGISLEQQYLAQGESNILPLEYYEDTLKTDYFTDTTSGGPVGNSPGYTGALIPSGQSIADVPYTGPIIANETTTIPSLYCATNTYSTTSTPVYYHSVNITVTDTTTNKTLISYAVPLAADGTQSIVLDYTTSAHSLLTPTLYIGGNADDVSSTSISSTDSISLTLASLVINTTTTGSATSAQTSYSFTRLAGDPIGIGIGADQVSNSTQAGFETLLASLAASYKASSSPAVEEEYQDTLLAEAEMRYWQEQEEARDQIAALNDDIVEYNTPEIGIMTGSPVSSPLMSIKAYSTGTTAVNPWTLAHPIFSLQTFTDNPGAQASIVMYSPNNDMNQLLNDDSSALESTILSEMFNLNSISTITGFQSILAASPGLAPLSISPSSTLSVDTSRVDSKLINLSSSDRTQIFNDLMNGFTITQIYDQQVTVGANTPNKWQGIVWTATKQGTDFGYFIYNDSGTDECDCLASYPVFGNSMGR